MIAGEVKGAAAALRIVHHFLVVIEIEPPWGHRRHCCSIVPRLGVVVAWT